MHVRGRFLVGFCFAISFGSLSACQSNQSSTQTSIGDLFLFSESGERVIQTRYKNFVVGCMKRSGFEMSVDEVSVRDLDLKGFGVSTQSLKKDEVISSSKQSKYFLDPSSAKQYTKALYGELNSRGKGSCTTESMNRAYGGVDMEIVSTALGTASLKVLDDPAVRPLRKKWKNCVKQKTSYSFSSIYDARVAFSDAIVLYMKSSPILVRGVPVASIDQLRQLEIEVASASEKCDYEVGLRRAISSNRSKYEKFSQNTRKTLIGLSAEAEKDGSR
jgi:hypothetical protein